MLRYGFFDSEITGYDEEGMPIFDRAESSDFLAMFISNIISDGVMARPGDCFQVMAFEGMKLKIRPGFGIVKGRFVFDENDFYITVPNAPISLKRIDRVILRANYPQRLCEIMIAEGEPAANPVPVDLIRPVSGDYYELCLATIAVNSNQTVITQSNITDTRYDSSVCGVVTQAIDHIETSALFAQLRQFYSEYVARSDSSYEKYVSDMDEYLKELESTGTSQMAEIVAVLQNFETMSEQQFLEWFNQMKDQLSEDAAGHLQIQISKLKEDIEKVNIPDFDDSGEVEGIESFSDFMPSFVKGTPIYKLLENLKAGLKYVLHAGQLVNNGLCETPGQFPLDAAYGKALTDQITGLYSDLGGFEPVIDETGRITGYKTTVGGADTVFPFSEIDKNALLEALSASGLNIDANSTPEEIYTELKRAFPGNITTSIQSPNGGFNNGWVSPKMVCSWYGARYNLTGYKSLKFSIGYYYYDNKSSAGHEKYYYNAFDYYAGVALSKGDAFLKSTAVTNIGKTSKDTSMSGTATLTLDVSDLEGYYYIGVGVKGLNTYTGGSLSENSWTSNCYTTCYGVVFS